MSEPLTNDQAEIEAELQAHLPEQIHPLIPTLTQVLAAARSGMPASVATEYLCDALYQLQGKTLNIQGDSITVGNITGEGIAIGHGAQATVIRIYVPRTEAQRREWRNRSRMLEKVRAQWVDGFLRQSLRENPLIKLGMRYSPDALEHPWEMLVQFPDWPRTLVPPGRTIADVFDAFCGELLILGTPGTGKTTELLNLTRTLLMRAEQDKTRPIPVVFNLSSWAVKRPALANWLVEELHIRYDVPRRVAHAWIARDEVLPLLDGLDEVRPDARDACVAAINRFREEHGLVGMAVCSRSADYEMLTRKLRLQGAVLLQPLTERQIEEALRHLGDQARMVRQVLRHVQDNARQHNDPAAEELSRTPLMLSITTLAYQGDSDGDLPPPDAPPAEQQRHLFAVYVERMFQRRDKPARYTPEQTKRWLAWLAGKLIYHDQTVFFLELMQPTWLHRAVWGRFDLWVGLARGGVVGVAVWAVATPLIILLLLISGLAPIVWRTLGPDGARLLVLVGGVLCGLFFALVGAIAARRNPRPERIHLVEKLIVSGTAMQSALKASLGVGIPVGLILAWGHGWPGVLAGGATGVALWTLVVGRVVTATSQSVVRSVPNQGIWHSARNALLLSLLAGTSVGVATGLSLTLAGVVAFGTLFGLAVGIGVVVFAALFFGVEPLFKHALLRVLLWQGDCIPWNYWQFLDEVAGRILLRKVGGGYVFAHRLLMEYFASLEPARPTPEGDGAGRWGI